VEILLKHYFPHENYYSLPLPPVEVPQTTETNPKKRKLEGASSSTPTRKELTLKPIKDMKGHTSYLTFATLLPQYEELVIARDDKNKDDDDAGDDGDKDGDDAQDGGEGSKSKDD